MNSLTFFRAFVLALIPGVASAGPPSDDPHTGLSSLSEHRHEIAWYGAACIMGASQIDTRAGPSTLASVAEETGVPLEQIQTWAAAREAEHAIAQEVLFAGGEPLRDPPEPFLTILRQAQSDCQDLDRARYALQAALDRGQLPATAPQIELRALRATLDPLPFDFERRFRLMQVLRHGEDAADFPDDYAALLKAVSGLPTVTPGDIPSPSDLYPLSAIATDLLLPDPTPYDDLSPDELRDILARIEADPTGPFTRYYAGLLAANTQTLEEMGGELVLFSVPFDGDQNPVCNRIAGSAALSCVSD